MGGESGRRGRLTAALVLGSPCLAAAMTIGFFVAAHALRPWVLPGPARCADDAAIFLNAALAFVGTASGGLMARGGAARRSASSAVAGLFGLARRFGLLAGAVLFALGGQQHT